MPSSKKGNGLLKNLDDGSLFVSLDHIESEKSWVLVLYTQGDGYVLQINFSIKQKLRKPSELREFFNEMETKPTLCAVDVQANCLKEIPFTLVEGWKMNKKLVATISLKLSRSALLSIANGSQLEFDPDFPWCCTDIWPNVTVSTEKLKGLINALDRSR